MAEDYKAKVEELEKEKDKLEEIFEMYKRKSEQQTEEFEQEIKQIQSEISDLQNQIEEKNEELAKLKDQKSSSNRGEVKLKEKTKEIEEKIKVLTEDVRKLENECTGCRQSVRIETARMKNISMSLTQSHRREQLSRANLDAEKERQRSELEKLESCLEDAKEILQRAKKKSVTKEQIREQINSIKTTIGLCAEAEQDESNESAYRENGPEPSFMSEAKDGIGSDSLALDKIKCFLVSKSIYLKDVLSKRMQHGDAISTKSEIKDLFKAVGEELNDSQLDVIMANYFDREHKKLRFESLLQSIRDLEKMTAIGTLNSLSTSTRHFIVARAIAHTFDGKDIPDTVSALKSLLQTSQEDDEDEVEEMKDVLESKNAEKMAVDVAQACKAVLGRQLETSAISPKKEHGGTSKLAANGQGKTALGKLKASELLAKLVNSSLTSKTKERKAAMKELESFDKDSFRSAYKKRQAAKDPEGQGSSESEGWKARDAVLKRRGLRSRIFDQRKRHNLNLARIVPLAEEKGGNEPKPINLDDFLDDYNKTDDHVFCYERNHLDYVVPMALKAIMLYHSYKPMEDSNFERCMAKALAIFNVSDAQLNPLWTEIEPLSFMEEKGKRVFLEELRNQAQRSNETTKRTSSKLIKALEEELKKIQEIKEEKKRKQILEQLEDEEEEAQEELSFWEKIGCCSSEKEDKAAREKRKLVERERRRNELLLAEEKKADEERKRKMQEARNQVFKRDNGETRSAKDREAKPLPRIPPLSPEEIKIAYNNLYATLMEVDNATSSGIWREFGTTFEKKDANKLNEKITAIDDVSRSMLNRFSLVYGVDSVSRFLHSTQATYFSLNLKNVGPILTDMLDGIKFLELTYKKERELKKQREMKTQVELAEPAPRDLLAIPNDMLQRSKTLGIVFRARPGDFEWEEEQEEVFLKIICRSFQWCYWCFTKYHIAFAQERKESLESRRKGGSEGMRTCAALLTFSKKIINENFEAASAVLKEDDKVKLQTSEGKRDFMAAAGYGPAKREFFVTETALPNNATWTKLVQQDSKELIASALSKAAFECYNDFVTLTEPPKRIQGRLKISIGKISQLAGNVTRLGKRDKITYSIEAAGKTKSGPSIRLEDGDFGNKEMVFKNVQMMTPVVIEIYEDKAFTDRLIGSVSLDLYSMHRDREAPKEVALEDVKLREVKGHSTVSPLVAKVPDHLFIFFKPNPDLPFRNSALLQPGSTKSPTLRLESGTGDQKRISLKKQEKYPLGYPLDDSEIKASVEIDIEFLEEESSGTPGDTAPSSLNPEAALFSSSALGIKDVVDAPQLANVLVAIMQEVESDIIASKNLKEEIGLQMLDHTLDQYFTSCRLGLQFLLKREEWADEEGSGRRHISQQILTLYKLMKDFQNMLVKNGFDLAHGAGEIEPLFEPYISGWIKDKEDLLRIVSIPKIIREQNWDLNKKFQGEDDYSDDDDVKHGEIVVEVYTLFHNILTYFQSRLPYTQRNQRELMQMFITVLKDGFVGEITLMIEEKLAKLEKENMLWGLGAVQGEGKVDEIIPKGLLVMMNTIEIAVGECGGFFLESKGKVDDDLDENADEKQVRQAFDQYGLYDMWLDLQSEKLKVIDSLAIRVACVLSRHCKESLKDIDENSDVIKKAEEACKSWTQYLDAFFIPWTKLMYLEVYKETALAVLQAVLGPRYGIERILLNLLEDKPPKHLKKRVEYLLAMTNSALIYFGKNGLGLELEELKVIGEGTYLRINTIVNLVLSPSRVLMEGGGIADEKKAKENEANEEYREEHRRETEPYVYRSTVSSFTA